MSDGFVSLPFDREFCFKYSDRYIKMKTNRFGARLLDAGEYEQTALAFGESQLLGLDASDIDGQHDLSALFLPDALKDIICGKKIGTLIS